MSASYDSIWLLKTLQKVIAGVHKTINQYHSLFHALKDFYYIRQKEGETVEEYYRRFEAAQDLVTLSKGSVTDLSGVLAHEQKADASITEAQVLQKFLAMGSLRFKDLWRDLKNSLTMKQDHFPTSLAESIHMLTHWKGNKGNTNTGNRRNDNSDRAPNLGFHQSNGGTSTTFVPGTDGTTTEHITCFNCDDPGHYASVCPKPRVAFQGMQFELCNPCSFNQDVTKNILPQNWVRIDSGSSFNSFNDSTLLSDIKSCDEMRAYSNGGHLDYEKNGTVSFLPEIDAYNNKNSLANILALSSVTKYCRVTMDSAQADCLLVHLAADETLFYEKCGNGLYFLNLDGKSPVTKLNKSVSPYSFFHTVASNKEFSSQLEIEGADKAQILQSCVGWPSDQELLEAVRDNLVINATVTVDDIRRAIAIYGTAVPLIKGKMIRKTHN